MERAVARLPSRAVPLQRADADKFRALGLFTRFVSAALYDADFHDTEAFFDAWARAS